MDRIIKITRWLALAFWRRFGRGGSSGSQGILLIFSVLILARYVVALHKAASELAQNRPALFESLLVGILLIWMFPLLGNVSANVSTRKLMHLPLSRVDLFCIRLLTLFFPPSSWAILAASLAICYPIARAQNPLVGVIAALCFICFSALTGVAIVHLLRLRLFRQMFFATLLAAGSVILYLGYNHGPLRVSSLSSFTPVVLVTRAAMGSWLAVTELALLAAGAFIAGLWAFNRTLEITAKPRSQKFRPLSAFRLPGAVGGLVAKDFRYFRRLLDSTLGVLVAIVGCLYLIAAEVTSATLVQIFVLTLIACNTPLAFNAFGLDNRAAMDRLKLMPLTGRTILAAKNVAFLMVVGVQLAPLIVLSFWRLGFFVGSLTLAGAAAMAAMYLSWGNWQSINHPFKMQFYQFASSSGTLVEAIAGIGFGSLPGVVAIYAMRGSKFDAAWKIALTLSFSGALYLLSLRRAGTRYSLRHDRIASALG